MSLHSLADFSPYYSIKDFSVASGDIDGVSVDGRFVHISQGLCDGLEQGEVKNILTTYKLIGRYGSEIPQTAIFKVSRTQDGPIISSPFEDQPFIKDGAACFDLILNDSAMAQHASNDSPSVY